jgi:hypothetical protein
MQETYIIQYVIKNSHENHLKKLYVLHLRLNFSNVIPK